ncbi:hypothetical protein BSNK01_20290 [Bacillaceae bacterium]
MPNNMEGRGLTDREMLQLCLELAKARCRSLCHTIMETSHSGLRDVYRKCLEVALRNQQEIFTMMDERGWYRVEMAGPEQIGSVQELLQNNLHPDDRF